MKIPSFFLSIAIAIISCFGLIKPETALAEMAINQSRYVLYHSDREAVIYLKNTGTYPVIVQSWVDDGKVSNLPQQADDYPALTLPPLLYLKPQELKTIRLMNKFQQQDSDIESLYWINLYELMPNDQTKSNTDVLNINVRLQFKLFYRPDTLKMDISQIGKLIQFKSDENHSVNVSNNSNFYVSFNHILYENQSQLLSPLMIAPLSTVTVKFKDHLQSGSEIDFGLIDDDGLVNSFQSVAQ